MKKLGLIVLLGVMLFAFGCENIDITLEGTFTNQTNVIKTEGKDTTVAIAIIDWKLTTAPTGDSIVITRGEGENSMTYYATEDVSQEGTFVDTLFGVSNTTYYYGLFLYDGGTVDTIHIYDVTFMPTIDVTSPGDTVTSDTINIEFTQLEEALRYTINLYETEIPLDSLSSIDAEAIIENAEEVYGDIVAPEELTLPISYVPDVADSSAVVYILKITGINDLNTSTTLKPFGYIKGVVK